MKSVPLNPPVLLAFSGVHPCSYPSYKVQSNIFSLKISSCGTARQSSSLYIDREVIHHFHRNTRRLKTPFLLPLSKMKAHHQGKPIQCHKRKLRCYKHRLVRGVFPPPLPKSLHYCYNDKWLNKTALFFFIIIHSTISFLLKSLLSRLIGKVIYKGEGVKKTWILEDTFPCCCTNYKLFWYTTIFKMRA